METCHTNYPFGTSQILFFLFTNQTFHVANAIQNPWCFLNRDLHPDKMKIRNPGYIILGRVHV